MRVSRPIHGGCIGFEVRSNEKDWSTNSENVKWRVEKDEEQVLGNSSRRERRYAHGNESNSECSMGQLEEMKYCVVEQCR